MCVCVCVCVYFSLFGVFSVHRLVPRESREESQAQLPYPLQKALAR